MMKQFFCAVIIATTCIGTLTGCSGKSVEVTKTSKGFQPATDPDNVEVLTTLPNRRFIELGTFSTSSWTPSRTAQMHNALRQKAAGLGPDAVVIQSSGVNSRGYLWSTGVAIKYQ